MRPHPQDTNRALLRKHFVHQTVLDVDPSRIRTREVAHQFLKGRRVLERIDLKDIQEGLGFIFKPTGLYFFRVLQRLLCVDDGPAHHFKALALLSSGSDMPVLMDSLIPGTDSRYRVSCIALQSSAAISTALLRLPEINTGWCELAVSSIRRYKLALASLADSVFINFSNTIKCT